MASSSSSGGSPCSHASVQCSCVQSGRAGKNCYRCELASFPKESPCEAASSRLRVAGHIQKIAATSEEGPVISQCRNRSVWGQARSGVCPLQSLRTSHRKKRNSSRGKFIPKIFRKSFGLSRSILIVSENQGTWPEGSLPPTGWEYFSHRSKSWLKVTKILQSTERDRNSSLMKLSWRALF